MGHKVWLSRIVGSALLALGLGCQNVTGADEPSPHGQPTATASTPAAGLLGPARQLTFSGRRSGEGYFSADGKQLIFQSEREPGNPFYQIYRLDLETGDIQRVSPGTGKTTCGWIHPDGERVLFASTHLDSQSLEKQQAELDARESGQQRRYSWDYDPHYDLFSNDRSRGQPLRLTSALGYDAEASWSPDGQQIVFASNRHAFASDLSPAEREKLDVDPAFFIELYRMDADGQNVQRLTQTDGYDGGPFFSPDGDRIVWRRFSEDGLTAEIFSMRSDGSDVRQLTRLGAMSWAPFYHPSGDYILFATNLHGFANFELYLVDAEGTRDPVRVTHSEGFDGLPAFAPDGAVLAWTRRAAGAASAGSQLFRAKWSDGRARELLGLESAPSLTTEAALSLPSGISPSIEIDDLREYVSALASDETEGRLTGTRGERIATAYVARAFQELGLEPAGEEDGYFQEFDFTAGVSIGDENRLQVLFGQEPRAYSVDEEWRPLSFSQLGEIPASEVVFAGYGIVSPEGDEVAAIDSYAGLDVRGRWVLIFRYIPGDLSGAARQHLTRFASLRYKAMIARERGARGMLVLSGPNSKVREELVKLRFDASFAGTSVAAVSIRDRLGEQLLAKSGHSVRSLQTRLDAGEQVAGFTLEGVRVSANIDLRQERRTGRNVLAALRAGSKAKPPAILIGAHVDHLGRGEAGTSLARNSEAGMIHYGADDNASGVAAVLEIAHSLADRHARGELALQRDVLFAAWSGEELGLLGANHYATALPGDSANADPHSAARSDLSGQIGAYLNMDMVGRLDEELSLFGVGSSSLWMSEIERANVPIGLAISPQEDGYLPTDSTVFYLKGVPILSAFTGSHEDYHSPRDRPEKLNYEGLRDVSRLVASIAQSLATRSEAPEYVASAPPVEGAARAGLRVYLGTVPDYSDNTEKGLRLSGVVLGGPADQAGLREGDVIVEVDGRAIENIYDYTYSLDALRVGEAAAIVVMRDHERLTLEVVPASRD